MAVVEVRVVESVVWRCPGCQDVILNDPHVDVETLLVNGELKPWEVRRATRGQEARLPSWRAFDMHQSACSGLMVPGTSVSITLGAVMSVRLVDAEGKTMADRQWSLL